MIIAGPMVIAIGQLILGNKIPYASNDPRADPLYGQIVVALSVGVGLLLMAVGIIRLRMAIKHRRK
jgi:hypothetical protein